MNQLTVRNFRGVSRADIPLMGIQLISGLNASGKSSVAQAAGGVLARVEVPIQELTKTESKCLVKTGSDRATARIQGTAEKSWSCEISWPDPKVVAQGPVPYCSTYAAGLDSIVFMKPKERAQFLTKALGAEPTQKDVLEACKDKGLSEELAKDVWKSIDELTFDGALTSHKETGTKLKGQWEYVTKANFGTKIYLGWKPKGWDEKFNEKSLTEECEKLKKEYQEAVRLAAIWAEKQKGLEEEAAKHPALQEQLDRLEKEFKDSEVKLEEAKKAKHEAAQGHTALVEKQACPGCGIDLVIKAGKISKPATHEASKEEIQKHLAKLELFEKEIQKAEEARNQLDAQRRLTSLDVNNARKAKERLASIGSVELTGPPDGEAIAKKLHEAQSNLQLCKDKKEADALETLITQQLAVVALLQPDGIRQQKLATALAEFRKDLAALSSVAAAAESSGWQTVSITDDLRLQYGDKNYFEISESEKFRFRLTLQCALAQKDGSWALVIDAADLLDKGGRNGMFRLLKHVGKTSLVFMTFSNRDEVPDLSKLGGSYWLKDGVAEPAKQEAVA